MIPRLDGALEVFNSTEENRVVHIGELCCQREEQNSYCINDMWYFHVDLRVFFPTKKDKPIYFTRNSQNNLSFPPLQILFVLYIDVHVLWCKLTVFF